MYRTPESTLEPELADLPVTELFARRDKLAESLLQVNEEIDERLRKANSRLTGKYSSYKWWQEKGNFSKEEWEALYGWNV